MHWKNEKLPDCEEITEQFRKSDDYSLFCDNILKYGYGVSKWKTRCVHQKMSTFIRPAFEAFVLLAYENCYEAYKDGEATKDPSKKFKYTVDRRLCNRNKGWPDEAILRYNELHARIVVDREQNSDFDDVLLETLTDKYMKKKDRRKRKGDVTPARVARNDLGVGINWYEI